MKIFVTGTEGYIGSLLAPMLIGAGNEVIACDTGFYKESSLYHTDGPTPYTLAKDIRNLDPSDLEGCDAVVHMAELSNDPTGALAPNITYDINHKASLKLAQIAKDAGVTRFIYTSSCSVYGVATGNDLVTEKSPTNPQTAYAECKTYVERDVTALADTNFSPTFLRNATAYGISPRMRFDIVVNNLSGLARTTKVIKMISDGSPWRPQVHVLDICKAIKCSLEAPREAVHNEIFNVGRTDENFTVKQIAEMVANIFEECELSFGPSGGDNRSYRVSFNKIATELPGFSCDWGVQTGIQQLHDLFKLIDMDEYIFDHRAFTRLKSLTYLLESGQINKDFFWSYPKGL